MEHPKGVKKQILSGSGRGEPQEPTLVGTSDPDYDWDEFFQWLKEHGRK